MTLVFFDFDGTLCPVVRHPDDARITKEVARKLYALSRRVTVIVLTGRSSSFVQSQLPEGVVAWGLHGNVASRKPAHLRELERKARATFVGQGFLIESKPLGFAIHYRGVSARVRGRARESVERFAFHAKHVRCIRGRLVMEFMPANSAVKGDVVESIVRSRPRERIVYVGDDHSDAIVLKRCEKFKNFRGALVRSRELRVPGVEIISRSELFSFVERSIRVRS